MGETSWSHDNKGWQKTLDLARELGWPAPVKTKNHGVLVLECPSKEHKIRIFSTGSNTERVAIQTRAKIRNCAHRDLDKPLVAIRTALDGAELMLDAAERLLHASQAEASAMEALENVEVAGERLEEVEALFEAASQAWERADREVEELVPPEHAERPVSELTAEAAGRLREADLTLRDDLPKAHPGPLPASPSTGRHLPGGGGAGGSPDISSPASMCSAAATFKMLCNVRLF